MKRGLRVWTLAIIGGLLALLMATAWLSACGNKPIGDEHPILQAAVDAMKEVDSFHFSEFEHISYGVGGVRFSASGDFQSPNRIQKRAFLVYPVHDPRSQTSGNIIRNIAVGSASYLLDPATGKWMNIDGPGSFSSSGGISKLLQRRPIAFFESVVSSLGPDTTVDTISVDGIDLFHIRTLPNRGPPSCVRCQPPFPQLSDAAAGKTQGRLWKVPHHCKTYRE